jgi:ABC-2 type transport system permease protein
VSDLDHSALSARVVAALRADASLSVSELDPAQALAQVREGKMPAALTLPAGFGASAGAAMFGAAPKPDIEIHYDPSQAIALSLVRGLLAQHVMEVVSQATFSAHSPVMDSMRQQVLDNPALGADQRADLMAMFDSIAKVQRVQAAPSSAGVAEPAAAATSSATPGAGGGLSVPYTTHETPASANPTVHYNSYAHSFAGMGVQFILFMGLDLAIGLLMMRRLGLWKRLRAAPLSRSTLLGSRIASCALIALIIFGVIYAVAMAVFGVRVQGSWPGFILVLLAFSLLTASFGLLIAALGKTPEATRGLAILVTLMLVMLGGAWVPAFIFPGWLQTVSLFVPTRWAIDGLDAMTWRGLGFQAALAPVGVMLAFTLAFAAIAIARFNWEE